MKVCLGQINPTVGDTAGNLREILNVLEGARRAGASLVVLPELALVGYPPQDLLDYPALVDRNLAALDTLAAQSKGLTVLCGFVDRRGETSGRPYANGAALIQGGKVVGRYHKQLLPTYDVFDERRFFEPGTIPLSFECEGAKFAVTLCEDLWTAPGALPRPYPNPPTLDLVGGGAKWIVNLSASPFHVGKPALREKLFGEAARRWGAGVIFCNQVGGNDGLLFDGGSFVLGADGSLKSRAPAFETALWTVDLQAPSAVSAVPKDESAWRERALVVGIRDYIRKCGATRAVVGLSGGVDSSVVAVLSARALGPENVVGVALPTRYSAEASLSDARHLAERLGIEFHVCPVEPLREALHLQWRGWFGKEPQGLAAENLQPRLRMTVLMGLANERNAFLLNTSNKSELACGYSTLYGDSAGALGVLGDLLKGEVYALARHLNAGGELIPERVLTRPPSAELRENQTDQDNLPPYEQVDPLVRDGVEAGLSGPALVARGHGAAEVDRFEGLHRTSEYKRYQAPPILRVSPHAFGVGRRMPLAARFPFG